MKNRKVYNLNPSQSRRLIAKGITALPQVQEALQSGKLFVGRGATNAYVAEELMKLLKIKQGFNKADFVAGQIIPGNTFMKWTINKGNKHPEILFKEGKIVEFEDRVKEIHKFRDGDIIIKGANALDMKGVPAVLIGTPKGGGTIGDLQSTAQAKGLEIICPVGLEKLIFGDVMDNQQVLGIETTDMPSEGFKCGLIPMPYATIVTEIQALELLFDVDVYHIASGGVGGAEGSVSLLVNAVDSDEMKEIDKFMTQISQEPIYVPNQG